MVFDQLVGDSERVESRARTGLQLRPIALRRNIRTLSKERSGVY